LFQVCTGLGHDGVVAKKLDVPYVPGKRTRTWLKKKSPPWKRDHARGAAGPGVVGWLPVLTPTEEGQTSA
jgi:hypothetical protein